MIKLYLFVLSLSLLLSGCHNGLPEKNPAEEIATEKLDDKKNPPLSLTMSLKKAGTAESQEITSEAFSVSENDELQLRLAVKRTVYIAVYYRDSSANVYRLFPEDESRGKVAAGTNLLIPSGGPLLFDEQPGKNCIVHFHSDKPLNFQDLETWLEKVPLDQLIRLRGPKKTGVRLDSVSPSPYHAVEIDSN